MYAVYFHSQSIVSDTKSEKEEIFTLKNWNQSSFWILYLYTMTQQLMISH